MFKLAAAAMLLAGTAATAQVAPPAPAPAPRPSPSATPDMTPPDSFIAAAQAFGQCVGTKGQAMGASVTPEAAAHQALAGCATEKATLEREFETWVAGPTFPAAGRAEARTQFRAQIDGLEARVAERFREQRAQAAAAPAPAPTPAPTPTPAR